MRSRSMKSRWQTWQFHLALGWAAGNCSAGLEAVGEKKVAEACGGGSG